MTTPAPTADSDSAAAAPAAAAQDRLGKSLAGAWAGLVTVTCDSDPSAAASAPRLCQLGLSHWHSHPSPCLDAQQPPSPDLSVPPTSGRRAPTATCSSATLIPPSPTSSEMLPPTPCLNSHLSFTTTTPIFLSYPLAPARLCSYLFSTIPPSLSFSLPQPAKFKISLASPLSRSLLQVILPEMIRTMITNYQHWRSNTKIFLFYIPFSNTT